MTICRGYVGAVWAYSRGVGVRVLDLVSGEGLGVYAVQGDVWGV